MNAFCLAEHFIIDYILYFGLLCRKIIHFLNNVYSEQYSEQYLLNKIKI